MSIGTLLSGLVKPFTGLYANRQKRILRESDAQATVDEIYANATANDASAAAAIALVNAKNQNNTWKDEYALITITAPYWVSFVIALAATFGVVDVDANEVINAMFEPMSAIPEYWQETFKIGILSALGVTVLKKVIT